MPKAIPLRAVALTAAILVAGCGSAPAIHTQTHGSADAAKQEQAQLQPLSHGDAVRFKEAVQLARAAIILAKHGENDKSYDMLQMAKDTIKEIDTTSLTVSQRSIVNQLRQTINNALDALETGEKTSAEDRNAIIRDLASFVETDFAPIIGKI